MAATGSPSDQNPNQSQQPQQSPPHSETLDLSNSPKSQAGVENSKQSDKRDDALLIPDEDGQQSERKDDHQSGTTHSTLPEPIVLTDDTENLSPPPAPPVTSPTNRRANKRKKAGTRKMYKRKRPTKKVQTLTNILNPIPFVPTKVLDLDKHEDVLKRLGLYDFSKIEFDRSLRTDLIVQLIANYDSKKRGSYVNDLKVNVNRADLARAFKLPPAKQDRGSSSVEEVDLDSEVFSDESIEFIEDFVSSRIVLHDESRVVPGEMVNWTRCIRDGHPEKLDPASLIWYKVEKELTQADKLVDCYYASHLQYLIRSQRPEIFKEDGNNDDDGVADEVEEHVKVDKEKEEKDEEKEEKDEEKEEKYEEKEEKDEEKEEIEEEKETMVQEQNLELNLATKFEEPALEEVIKVDETMADADVEGQVDFKNVMNDHDPFLQRCQNNDLNNFEEIKVEEVEDEHEQIEEDEHIEQVDDEDEEDGERMEEGFDIEANDDSFDQDGLTGNFLQGVETSHNPYNSHGISSMDLFGSRDGSFMSHGGPSFYNNGGKRVMEPEEDIQMQNDIQNNKRLKTDDIWDDNQKQNDISFCFDQMQQLMQKAKMIHESKERSFENMQYSQQIAMDQLQESQQIMEAIIKSKDEELAKKHNEVFRLEREIYLMVDLLSGYRKALNDTRSKFSEYRKRFPLKEEPLYRDAGPGGLVLSVREIEKQRLKQEEDHMKFQAIAKNFEEECVYQFEMQNNRLLPMFDKLRVIKNEVKRLKEIGIKPKETRVEPSAELAEAEENQKLVNEDGLSVEAEKDQKPMDEDEENLKSMDEDEKNLKSMDEDESLVEAEKNQDSITENDASMDGVLPDAAGESEEKVDGKED